MKSKIIIPYVLLAPLSTMVLADISVLNEMEDRGGIRSDEILLIKIEDDFISASTSLVFILDKLDISEFVRKKDNHIFHYDLGAFPVKTISPHNIQLKVHSQNVDDPSESKELGIVELRILSTTGFSVAKFSPNIELSLNSKLYDYQNNAVEATERKTFNDINASISLVSEHKKNDLHITSTIQGVVVSNRQKALRFEEKQNKAPKVDLSEYIVKAVKGNTSIQLGHISQGKHPLLVDNLSNRGVMIEKSFKQRFKIGIALQNGRSITGYHHLLGFTDKKSRIGTLNLGIELLKRPDAAKLELSYISGQTVAKNDFDQGQIANTEKSSGYAIRLTTKSKSERLSTDTAFARSRFNNPVSGSLEANGEALVKLDTSKSTAYSTQFNYKLFSEYALTPKISLDLTAQLKYSRVGAEFRSLAASPTPDQKLKELEISGQIAQVGFNAKLSRSHDNLENIASILTSQNNGFELSFNTSFKEFFEEKEQQTLQYKLLPTWNVSFQRTHQFALNSPKESISDFNKPSKRPNQINRSVSNNLNWNFEKWDVGYLTEWSAQDNRQSGRELADFSTLGHSLNLNLRPNKALNISLIFGKIRNLDIEQRIRRFDYTRSLNLDWKINPRLNLTLSHSNNKNKDNKNIASAITANNEAKLSYQLNLPSIEGKKVSGQIFIRYTNQKTKNTNKQQKFSTNAKNSAIFAGINLSF